MSSGLERAYAEPVILANCKLFSERGAVFFTSDLPEDVWGGGMTMALREAQL